MFLDNLSVQPSRVNLAPEGWTERFYRNVGKELTLYGAQNPERAQITAEARKLSNYPLNNRMRNATCINHA